MHEEHWVIRRRRGRRGHPGRDRHAGGEGARPRVLDDARGLWLLAHLSDRHGRGGCRRKGGQRGDRNKARAHGAAALPRSSVRRRGRRWWCGLRMLQDEELRCGELPRCLGGGESRLLL